MPQKPDSVAQEIDAIDRQLQALEQEKLKLLSRKAELEFATSRLIASSSTLSLKDMDIQHLG